MTEIIDLNPFDLNFRAVTDTELIGELMTIADSLSTHPFFKDNWADFVPGPPQCRGVASELRELVQAAAQGDRGKIAERNAVRNKAERFLTLGAQYVVMRAMERNDPNLLQNTGFKPKGRSTKTAVAGKHADALHVPINLSARRGKVSGTAIIKGSHVSRGGPYLLHICKGDHVSEESWYSPGGHYLDCKHIQLNDLQSASRYHFRMRTDGPEGAGPWSPIVSLVIV